tara:strand:+ start:320 stop:634 length:315 start_codon:yes stop_codon:yes gene_type:complete
MKHSVQNIELNTLLMQQSVEIELIKTAFITYDDKGKPINALIRYTYKDNGELYGYSYLNWESIRRNDIRNGVTCSRRSNLWQMILLHCPYSSIPIVRANSVVKI